MGFSQSEKAAVIFSLLGHELSSQIFSQMTHAEQAKLIRALAQGRPLEENDVLEICEEFLARLKESDRSFNPAAILRKNSFAGIELPRASRVDEICEEIPDWILVDHLSSQLDSVVSAVLGSINLARAAKIFREFPAERQVRLLLTLSKEKVLEATVLDELEADLETLRLKTSSGRYGQRVGGGARVIALVQALEADMRSQILSEVEARDPALAQSLQGGLLSVERLSQLLPAHLAILLAQMKDQDIGSFLRGEQAAVQKIYLSGLSKRRREDIECLLAPEKKITQKQKAEACERLRQCATQLKGEGKIIFPWEESLVG